MTDYVAVPLDTDPNEIFDIMSEYMADHIEGWEPSDPQLDVIILSASSEILAEVLDVASDVPTSIFRFFGANLMNIQPVDESSAVVSSTWTVADDDGHTIPSDTTVICTNNAGIDVQFVTDGDVTIPEGSTTTAAGEVTLVAVEGTGAEGNDCSGEAELVDSLIWVDVITLIGSSSGGEDAEEDDEYLNRLAQELRLMSPRPIVATDFAILALRIPGVGRATAIDNYNLDTSTSGVDKCVTIIVTDEDGNAVSSDTLDAVEVYLASLRELNFLIFAGSPTYHTVAVTFTAVAHKNWDLADINARAEEAVTNLVSPTLYGLTAGETDNTLWVNDTTLRAQDFYTALNNVEGLKYVTDLAFSIDGGTSDDADKVMTGVAPMPQPGTIVGTIVPS